MQLNAFLDNFSPDSKRYSTIQSPEVSKIPSAFNKTVNFASSLNRADKELEDNCVSNMKQVSSNRITSSQTASRHERFKDNIRKNLEKQNERAQLGALSGSQIAFSAKPTSSANINFHADPGAVATSDSYGSNQTHSQVVNFNNCNVTIINNANSPTDTGPFN